MEVNVESPIVATEPVVTNVVAEELKKAIEEDQQILNTLKQTDEAEKAEENEATKDYVVVNDEALSKVEADSISTAVLTEPATKPVEPDVSPLNKVERGLNLEQVLAHVSLCIDKIESKDSFAREEVKLATMGIGRVYSLYPKKRIAVAEYLAERKFPQLAQSALNEFNTLGIFKSDSIWFPAYYFYNVSKRGLNLLSRIP